MQADGDGASTPEPEPPAQGNTGSAFAAADAAYKAFAQGDYQTALARAREAAGLAPQNPDYRSLLVTVQAALAAQAASTNAPAFVAADAAYKAYAGRDFTEALARANEALALDPGNASYQALVATVEAALRAPPPQGAAPGFVAAEAGYQAMSRKAYDLAAAKAAEAVRLAPANRNYRMLLIDALAAAGRLQAAEAAADAAIHANGADAETLAARGYVRQRAGQFAAAADDFAAALARRPQPGAVRGLRLALADAALSAKEPARALAALAPYSSVDSYDIAARRGYALTALGETRAALAAFSEASPLARTPAERGAMARSRIAALATLGQRSAARALMTQSLLAGDLAETPPLDLAYLALQVGDDALAAQSFAKAKAAGALPGRSNLDAGYTAARMAENAAAVAYFKAGLTAAAAGAFPLPPQEQFGVRRQISDLERTWGTYATVTYSAIGVMPSALLAPSAASVNRVAQVGTEIFWRPPVIGNRNGSIFEVFGRAFETIYDDADGPVGAATLQAYAGARWKPFGPVNLVLEVARLWAIGEAARNDWLTRAAFSTGEGTDLRVDVPAWRMWQVYAEVDRYYETPETVMSFEGRFGYSFRVDGVADGLVLTPFAAIGGGYDNILATPGALGAGPGLGARLWFNGDADHAPRSYIDANVQYRFRLAGDDRARGVFAGLTLSY